MGLSLVGVRVRGFFKKREKRGKKKGKVNKIEKKILETLGITGFIFGISYNKQDIEKVNKRE